MANRDGRFDQVNEERKVKAMARKQLGRCHHEGCTNSTIGRNTTCSIHHDYVLAEKEAQKKKNLSEIIKSIPEGWFLYSLEHLHTVNHFSGDEHTPMYWRAALQHVVGGRLTDCGAESPEQALIDAIVLLEDQRC